MDGCDMRQNWILIVLGKNLVTMLININYLDCGMVIVQNIL